MEILPGPVGTALCVNSWEWGGGERTEVPGNQLAPEGPGGVLHPIGAPGATLWATAPSGGRSVKTMARAGGGPSDDARGPR